MAQANEREYVIPLRRFWLNVPSYRRSRKAVIEIKKFVAKHMKVPDRDISKVKLDTYLNNDVWFKGRAKPPAKVKVKVTRSGQNILVNFVSEPDHVKFLKKKHEKFKKDAPKPTGAAAAVDAIKSGKIPKVAGKDSKDSKDEKPAEEVKHDHHEQTAEEKKDEKEKSTAVEQQNIKMAEQQAKADKHISKGSAPVVHRKALKK